MTLAKLLSHRMRVMSLPPHSGAGRTRVRVRALLFFFFFFKFIWMSGLSRGSLGFSDGKESACNAGDQGSIPGWGKIPWRRKWHPTPVFLPGKSYGWRSLAGYSPWGHKESDATERLAHLLGSHTSSPSMWFVLAPSRFDRGR